MGSGQSMSCHPKMGGCALFRFILVGLSAGDSRVCAGQFSEHGVLNQNPRKFREIYSRLFLTKTFHN